jgi:hypothetical protein
MALPLIHYPSSTLLQAAAKSHSGSSDHRIIAMDISKPAALSSIDNFYL